MAHRTRIKICGITTPYIAYEAAYLGVDAVGFVFYPPSPRAVTVPQAQAMKAVLPPFVMAIGLFVNADPAWIRSVVEQVGLHGVQLHGDETPEYCEALGLPYIKAVPMGDAVENTVEQYATTFQRATGLLLDSHQRGHVGGSGQGFNWQLVPPNPSKPLIVAGGLNSHSVSEAICRIRPWGVDVSSGVERTKGIKDIHLIAAFIQAVRDGDQQRDNSSF